MLQPHYCLGKRSGTFCTGAWHNGGLHEFYSLLDKSGMNQLRRMAWAGHVAERITYCISLEPKRRRPLWRPQHSLELSSWGALVLTKRDLSHVSNYSLCYSLLLIRADNRLKHSTYLNSGGMCWIASAMSCA